MAQRNDRRGGGRGSARPTPARRAGNRRTDSGRVTPRRSESSRAGRREVDPALDADVDGAIEHVETDAGVLDSGARQPIARRLRGLSPKRAVLLAMVVSVVALTLAVPMRTYFSQQSEADQLRSANTTLQTEVSGLRTKVDEQNDPAYIEAQARDRLGFVNPGDKALVMQFPTPPEKSDDQKRAERQAQNPWYTNLLESVSTPAEK